MGGVLYNQAEVSSSWHQKESRGFRGTRQVTMASHNAVPDQRRVPREERQFLLRVCGFLKFASYRSIQGSRTLDAASGRRGVPSVIAYILRNKEHLIVQYD
jgi:hypothetical protein